MASRYNSSHVHSIVFCIYCFNFNKCCSHFCLILFYIQRRKSIQILSISIVYAKKKDLFKSILSYMLKKLMKSLTMFYYKNKFSAYTSNDMEIFFYSYRSNYTSPNIYRHEGQLELYINGILRNVIWVNAYMITQTRFIFYII